ncbi:MAG: hypothetical protein Q7T41_04365 [Candidatus Saccharibacteria bacterium]|nr:hypothetical protein [Candidatus Saccharibacteria bacterium]
MSRTYSTAKNRQQKHPKIYFEQYLYNASEPIDDDDNTMPAELEAELLENNYNTKTRHQFRRIAQRLRNSNS